MVACIPLLIGEALMVCAMNYWTMVAGRVSVGIGIGLSSSLVPVYISEVPPPFPPEHDRSAVQVGSSQSHLQA